MNIAVSAPAASLPVPPPAPIADPMIAAIASYRAGMAAFNEASKGIPDDEWEALAEETYSPCFTLLQQSPPVRSMEGVIAVLRFARDEPDAFFNDVGVGASIVGRALEFLESSAGSALAHPDAALLALGAEIDRIDAKIEEIAVLLQPTDAQDKAFREDNEALTISAYDRRVFGHIVCNFLDGYWGRIAIENLRPYGAQRGPIYGTAEEANKRIAELKSASKTWRKRLDDFRRKSGRSKLSARMEKLGNEVFLLKCRILEMNATTLAGAKVKARLLRQENSIWWETPNSDLQFEEEMAKSLVDDILSVEG